MIRNYNKKPFIRGDDKDTDKVMLEVLSESKFSWKSKSCQIINIETSYHGSGAILFSGLKKFVVFR